MINTSLPHADAAKRAEAVLAELKAQFNERVSCNESVCEAHSHGEALQVARMPTAVVFAESTADVSEVLKLAFAHKTRGYPFCSTLSDYSICDVFRAARMINRGPKLLNRSNLSNGRAVWIRGTFQKPYPRHAGCF